MFKRFIPLLLVALGVLLPQFALAAETLNPQHGNAWTLYVYGNGDVIFNILMSIKLLMVPDAGSSGFNTLLMFLATVGFLLLAVQAGFDPGKNLMKMFFYILVVSAVHITTMQITANIEVRDPIKGTDNVASGVPALVGVPAAVVSEVGHWFSKTIESYYTMPSEVTMSGGGTFNLFGRMMQESNEYVISQEELKKSLSAYVGDCVVPAMATGKIRATDLSNSPNMTDVLANATHNAILTKYWPVGTPDANSTNGSAYPSTLTYGTQTYDVQGGLGAIVPCVAAWNWLRNDLDKHADALMDASAKAWSKTGVLVPFEQGMSAIMGMASNGGANPFANYSKPQGYILQQAMLNTMNGSFRQAAASIGNNEVLMAASIAQAEQSQKSSWFTAARVFNNMMGYVYTTLQAFVFAIVPIVIVSLMVPGLGRSIFTNYAQILVWLTLWQPMLSIVNYLITLFAQSQIGSTMDGAGGVTMSNRYAFQESTNDLMLAAQFLGTSVPLLTWGLVKGSLAFTEFISHGIGSSMAQQAGATAATGNMSMGNMSMDNTSMNKFNTAMSSAVGAQSTMGYVGGMADNVDKGGHTQGSFGSTESRQVSNGLSAAAQASLKDGANLSQSASNNMQVAHSTGKDNRITQGSQEASSAINAALTQATQSYNNALSSGNSKAIEQARSAMQEVGNAAMTYLEASAKAGGQIKWDSDKQIVGKVVSLASGSSGQVTADVSGGTGGQASSNWARRASALESWRDSGSFSDSTGTANGGSQANSVTSQHSAANTTSRDTSWSESDQRSVSEALSRAASKSHEAAVSMSVTADSSDKSTRNEHYSDVQDAGLDNTAYGPNSVAARVAAVQTAAGGQVGAPLKQEDKSFSALTPDKVQEKYNGSPAADAPAKLKTMSVQKGAPTTPTAPPGGGDAAAQFQKGNAKATSVVSNTPPAMAAKKAELDKTYQKVDGTGAASTAAGRLGEGFSSMYNKYQGKGPLPVLSPTAAANR